MLIEHDFVTTCQEADALGRAASFLQDAGFRIRETSPGHLKAVRGRAHANTRKVIQLPQFVTVEYDRGRLTVGAGIEPRGNKDKPAHHALMVAMALALEHLLAHQEPAPDVLAEWRRADASAGSLWTAMDVIGFLLLGVAGALMIGGIVLLVVLILIQVL